MFLAIIKLKKKCFQYFEAITEILSCLKIHEKQKNEWVFTYHQYVAISCCLNARNPELQSQYLMFKLAAPKTETTTTQVVLLTIQKTIINK